MADKYSNSNNDAEDTENRTDSCCSSTNLDIKQENTSCCASNKDLVNSLNSIPIFIQTETSCCSSNTSKETDKELEKINCCSTSLPSEKKQETTNCCSSNTTIKEDETLVNTSCCSSNEQQTISNSLTFGEKMAYRVHGMDCPACAKTIEKGLSILKDIAEVKVNYNTAKMQVAASHLDAFIPIESEIKKLGYSIEPLDQKGNTKTFEIAGMDCGSCAKSIEKHLNTLSTVKNVSVNFSTGKMKIEHSDSDENIISEVSKIGFKASLQLNKKSVQTNKNKNDNGLITLSGILIALGFIGSFNGISPIMSTILYAIAMVISGFKPVKSAFYAIKSRSLDMNVLMSAAAIGAALIGEWLEGATVVWLFAIGNLLQTKSIERTRNSIRNLMDLAPPEAWVRVGSEIIKKSVEEITIGDIIIVKPGDKIPLDGEITQGASSVNQAPITGESIPVDKEIGDTVYAGTINENGSLEIRVTKLVEDTTISKIIHLVEEAQEQKAPTEAFVDKFASVYTPIVFILAFAIMLLPPLLGFGTWGDWFYKGLELLVVACPCALVISTPVAIVSAIGNAAKNGVLIKGGTFLEKAGAISAIAFDKTGTLTEGKPKVSEIKALNISKEELLSIALTLEDYSTHPIAKAIVGYTIEKGIQPKNGELFKSIVGKGIQATIQGEIFYAGNLRLFEEMNVTLADVKNHVQDMQNNGKTVIIIGTNHQVLGMIAVSDTIRDTTVSALKGLKRSGVNQTVMLTGDNEGSAKMIASEANVTRYFADLLPEDKVDAIKKLQNEGHNVAMVGDGINDAPALATADLGIAMGGAGTDTAMETADIVLMADNLDKLPHTMKLSRKALTIIKQNIWFSVIIKVIALVLIFPGWLTLWMAVLSDTGAALIVILNAIRLLKLKE
ncbi:heavy metal translocating P-type ATPase [Peribacillus frigoritolerans]|uniref:heavy metal translocating P-type ATPase n=1 Tax=Peribacillus frigoritolerans TaxID=450367 RepID=UPI002E1E9D54|nr:heavy metal translocating P-type ATPase [Peribacillus frigoritolerans]MED3785799.1 heavy metal translocating P-type ATPase [Peribacillus frigoritolerans]